MLFKAVLGNLEGFFFAAHLWWTTFKISFAVIFIKNTHESFLQRPHLDYGDIVYDQTYNASFHQNLDVRDVRKPLIKEDATGNCVAFLRF